jgi:glucose/arabinose dehydrogenase
MLATFLAAAALLAPQQQELSLQPYASGLAGLTAVVSTPAEPNRLYAVEQSGRIEYLVGGRVRGRFIDLTDRITSGGEQGLLSIAFHPNYKRNHRFYVDYTDKQGNTRVVEFRSRNGRGLKSTARQLLFVRQPYANHNGGELQFDRHGLLYVGMGDGGSAGDPGNRAQNPRQLLGKLLRINPLKRHARWQMVALGLRNPWRFSFDRANGDLYIGDVGQGNWEEIDYRPASAIGRLANYGWHVFEGQARFSSTPLGPGQLVAPVYVYSHENSNCSVTGGYVYRGRSVAAAVGRYFFGDFCSGSIWSLRIDHGAAVDARREPFTVSQLTSFGEDAAGELYLATGSGRIYKLGG